MADFPNAPWSIDPDDEWSILDKDGDKIADVSAALYKPGQGDLKITNVVYARQVRELAKAAPDLLEALLAHEEWEADIVFNADWSSGRAHLTQEQHDNLSAVQEMRNAAISKAKGGQS